MSRYSNKIESVGLRKCPYYRYLIGKVTSTDVRTTNISQSLPHKMADMKKLRQCHPMYRWRFGLQRRSRHEVTLRPARLVLRWVTAHGYTVSRSQCISSHSGQLSFPPLAGHEMSTDQWSVAVFCGYVWRRTIVMRYGLRGISTYWISGIRKAGEHEHTLYS